MKKLILLSLLFAVPVLAQEPPQGRRGGLGRGNNLAASTPASTNESPAAIVDERPIVTSHEMQLGGKTLKYKATVAQMPIMSATGDTEAHMFYVAYTLDDGSTNLAQRPLTFAFNGGPGAASIWVHMGAMGPKRAKLLDNGEMPPPPYSLVENDNSWLDQTDLVFVDAIGTGYSRAKTTEFARKYNGVRGDLQAFGEFIRLYVTRNSRWVSPMFLAGESYGTFRAAGLAGALIDEGIAFNGVVLISTILNFETARPSLNNGLGYALNLPTYTADAWYHKRLPADLQQDLKTTLKEVENWSMTGYLEALNKGDQLSPSDRKEVMDKLVRYTGLESRYIDDSEMRFGVQQFTRQLLRDKKLTIGRLDGRITGPSPLNAGETAEFDPSNTSPQPPYQATFLNYVRNDLHYTNDMTYYVSGGIQPWDWGTQNGYADTSTLLRNAFAKNPHLHVMVCAGYYDLATPYFAAEYTLQHLGIHPDTRKNISWQFYEAGHMMYIERQSHAKLRRDITDFIKKSIPAAD